MPTFAIYFKDKCVGEVPKAISEILAREIYAHDHDLSPFEIRAEETDVSKAKRAYLESILTKLIVENCFGPLDPVEVLYKLQHEDDFWLMVETLIKSYVMTYQIDK